MVVQTPPRHYSIEEYFALEETTEYRNKEIVAMTGGSINHNQIIALRFYQNLQVAAIEEINSLSTVPLANFKNIF